MLNEQSFISSPRCPECNKELDCYSSRLNRPLEAVPEMVLTTTLECKDCSINVIIERRVGSSPKIYCLKKQSHPSLNELNDEKLLGDTCYWTMENWMIGGAIRTSHYFGNKLIHQETRTPIKRPTQT